MGLKLSRGSRRYLVDQNADMNVTPFVDIMLVLLIIFMCSIPAATTSLKLDVPPAPPNQVNPPKPVWISVQEDGAIYVVDRKTSLETLPADLGAALAADPARRGDPQAQQVLIRADAEVEYDRFMAVMNRLKRSGYGKVSLISEDIA
jgi:biopolymer transport protein ExbD